MKLADLPLNPSDRMLRQFSAAWLAVFIAFALVQEFRAHNRDAALILASVALVGILGLAWPRMMKWLFVVATLVTFPIGWVLSNVLLALIYFLMITPIGIALRLRGRDELQRRRDPRRTSHWIDRGDASKPEKYLKQF
jgi:hypothetical protein